MSKFSSLALLIFMSFCAGLVQAVPVTHVFELKVDGVSDPAANFLLGTLIAGSVSYDTDALARDGGGEIYPSNGLTLSATFRGQVFTEADEQRRNSTTRGLTVFPLIEIGPSTGFQGMSFSVSETDRATVEIDEPGVTEVRMQSRMVYDSVRDVYTGNAELFVRANELVQPIPLPPGLLLATAGIGGIGFCEKGHAAVKVLGTFLLSKHAPNKGCCGPGGFVWVISNEALKREATG